MISVAKRIIKALTSFTISNLQFDIYIFAKVNNTIQNNDVVDNVKMTVINRDMTNKYGFPLKIVYIRKGLSIIVVSAFPVKKERQR